MRKNIFSYIFWFGLFLAISGIVLYCSRPTAGSLPVAEALSPQSLHPDRQTVWLRVDSLRTLLDPLQAQSGAFEWADKDDELRFEVQDTKEFEALFLNGRPLSVYANLKSPAFKALEASKGFAAPVTEKNKIRLVQLPADVVQSIQLYTQNTQ